MAEISGIINDSTRLTILAQVTRHGGGISAKEIAKNIVVPLTTVYHHLNALEKEGYICAEEVRVRNLNKRVWKRASTPIDDPETQRITNKHYQQNFSKEPEMISTYVTFFNALIKEDLVKLQQVDKEVFENFQKKTSTPAYVKMHLLDKDDFEYVMEKLMEIITALRERRSEKDPIISNYERTDLSKDMKYCLFTLALPDLDNLS
ncbi:MAG: helix-turn-helix domain-containing protein [Candidatus Hodarchaeales archaeon]|jgi:DNA-binding transcriptional ArsR family regulator